MCININAVKQQHWLVSSLCFTSDRTWAPPLHTAVLRHNKSPEDHTLTSSTQQRCTLNITHSTHTPAHNVLTQRRRKEKAFRMHWHWDKDPDTSCWGDYGMTTCLLTGILKQHHNACQWQVDRDGGSQRRTSLRALSTAVCWQRQCPGVS